MPKKCCGYFLHPLYVRYGARPKALGLADIVRLSKLEPKKQQFFMKSLKEGLEVALLSSLTSLLNARL